MKYLIAVFLLVTVSCGREKEVQSEIEWLYHWLEAWELISQEEFKLDKVNPPEMLFFDDQYVYTNSITSAPHGQKIEGPKLYGKEITWYKQGHQGIITTPDGQQVPVQIMTFAAPSENQNVESFFVMAAPSFWKNAGIDSEEVGLDNMLTGIFLHEFAHTRQMNGIGLRVSDYENNYKFEFPVSDDIIQHYFSQDSVFVQLFRNQTEAIYEYLVSEESDKTEINWFLEGFETRQEKFIRPEKEILTEMDKIFLTMEGIGQYAMVTWLVRPEGGGFSEEVAIKAARRGKNWWSQEEGLAWILLYRKISPSPDWKILFSETPVDIFELIKREVNSAA